MAEVSLGFLLCTVPSPMFIPSSYVGWAFYTYSHFYLMDLSSFQITLSTLASMWFMEPQQKRMDYTANEWIKWTQEAGSYDQLNGTESFKSHFYYLDLCTWLDWGFREPGSRQILHCLKNREVFQVDLPSLASSSSVVSIRISYDWWKNISVTAYIKLWSG